MQIQDVILVIRQMNYLQVYSEYASNYMREKQNCEQWLRQVPEGLLHMHEACTCTKAH